jgi:hypothetical protein
VTFSAWRASTISRYSTRENSSLKAELAEVASHLAATCGESSTIRKKKEIFSEVLEKSAAVDSTEPNSKDILELTPRFCQCEYFVNAKILLTK